MENKDELVQQEIDDQVFFQDPLPNRSTIFSWLQCILTRGSGLERMLEGLKIARLREKADDHLSPPLLPPLHQSLSPPLSLFLS
jgi:hypothetical protein